MNRAEVKGSKIPNDLHSKWTVYNHQTAEKWLMTLMGVHGKVLTGEEGDLQDGLWRRQASSPGQLSGHPAARDLLQVKAEPISEVRGASGKTSLRKGKPQWVEEGGGGEEWETTEGKPRWEKEEEKVLQVLEQIFPAAHGEPMLEEISCRTTACGEPVPEEGKRQRETAVHWP